ncbi:MAG: molecular chaperone HtpG [Verrucomicrobia bacterium]|nr:molecular chaperone HtpG [Verrucomicrobiota bacterium]
MSKKSRPFKTEVKQLLDLVIHSLYSKKEIFLRELISNASDAIDRATFEALTQPDLIASGVAWSIRLRADKAARTLTISDNGIGMSAEEVEQNIGTIASSGTRKFLEQMRQTDKGKDAELIGQFGVGFYAAFMVADKVELTTRRAGNDQKAVTWTSDGSGSYTLEDGTRDSHGTDITLHLREGMDEFCDDWRIRSIVKSYSNYIAHPILLATVEDPKDKDKDDAKADTKEDAEAEAKAKAESEAKPLNSMKAIWRRDKKDVSADEYKEFYAHISHDHQAPQETIHFSVEGATEFRALLFVPSHAPYDLFMRERKHGLQLYVKNVLIDADCEALLPEYLRFVKGVVDSSDLPLNVSREMLQDDALPRRIRKSLTGKVLGALHDMLENSPDEYRAFFVQFGKVLKEGLANDFENQDKLKDLLLYATSKTTGTETATLKQVVARMPEGQKLLYALAAESLEMARQSPHMEIFRKKDWEVLFWIDPVDEWIAQSLSEYDGKEIRSVERGDLDLDEGKESAAKAAEVHASLLTAMQSTLDADIQSVRFSTRLTDSACCLVTDANAASPTMERMMRAMNQAVPKSKRILELNPAHPLVARLESLHAEEPAGDKFKACVELLHGQALLQEGSPPKDPARFVKLLSDLMVRADAPA